ncbi:primosomal protein N', partial [Microbacterium aurum]|uniref:primosomal protein N' family DNA-binding protein n=1 Tax=Microbacterium aurum TaxID=36805 RepID=UPI001EF54021|nr:primosomal protein N' [Microbacterium aurum]
MTAVARVLIDSPLPQLDRLFDYAVPPELAAEAVPGARVRVPLRSAGRVVDGYLVELGELDPDGRPLSELDAVVSPTPVLTPALYALARRAADRAAGSASDILRLVIPKRMVRAEKAWLAAPAPEMPQVGADAAAWADGILAPYPGLADAVAAGERLALDAPPRPSTVQPVGAWAELLAAIAVRTLAQGRSAIVAVPDQRDQDQVLAVLARDALALAADAVVRDDARRSGPERYATYLRLLSPAPAIVVGNRSTVYAPAHDVGCVIIWDDGDPLLAEPLSPGVHARDAALIRQELEGSALVLAGHTRTTDVERLVQLGWVRELPAARRESPAVVLSATREGESRGARVPSSAFAAARDALTRGPVLVQVARPGYAPVLVCAECRTPARCRHCTGPLRARRPGVAPECAWCGRTAPAWACVQCGSTKLRMASSGSERTADELGRAFPNTRVIVADGTHPLTSVDARPALVVATRGAEPHAAGGYRAVILLDGDRMLLAEQLRIGESCLRWWSNAAALAAPGAPVHLVGVAGPVARALATWTQPAYARAELTDRTPLSMPPVVRVAAVEGTPEAVDAALTALRSEVPALPASAFLGPVPIDPASRGVGTASAASDTGLVRALVRFDYAHGRAVAEQLRAAAPVLVPARDARAGPRPRRPQARADSLAGGDGGDGARRP